MMMIKRNRRLVSLCMAVLLLATALSLAPASAKADAKLLPNGSVQYVYVQDADSLRAYIDDNGSYSSEDRLPSGSKYGNTYKIILEEPGDLLFYPLSREGGIVLELFSDFQLKSKLLEKDGLKSNLNAPYRIQVEAGTYYYRVFNRHSYEGKTTVFVGFTPADTQSLKENAHQLAKDAASYQVVNYAIVKNSDELARFIHQGMAYASQDQLGQQRDSNTYQFTVDRPGYLILAPITDGYRGLIRLYSNAGLTSMILEGHTVTSTGAGFWGISVDAGTYYYYGVSPDGLGSSMTVYIGFIPGYGEPEFVEQQVVSGYVQGEVQPRTTVDISPARVDDAVAFKAQVASGKPDLKDAIAGGDRKGRLARIELEEDGLLLIAAYGAEYRSVAYLYNNGELISRVLTFDVAKNKADDKLQAIYLDRGSYYYQVESDLTMAVEVDTHFGFIPSSAILSVASIQLSADKTEAVVVFSLDEAYNPDAFKGMIRVVPGLVGDRSLNQAGVWKETNNDNAIESRTYIARENGIYTARVSGSGLQSYMTSFVISGIGGRDWQPAGEGQQAAVAKAPAPTTEPAARPPMTVEEMLNHIAMLEDILLANGIDLQREAVRSFDEMEAYIGKLEQTLADHGIDY